MKSICVKTVALSWAREFWLLNCGELIGGNIIVINKGKLPVGVCRKVIRTGQLRNF